MPFPIGNYNFDGPFTSPDSIQDRAGLYVVYSKDRWLDVGEAGGLQSRLKTHERATCWDRHMTGTIYYGVLYTPYMQQSERMRIEKELRDHLRPTCGDR